ncbi:hypothetical protein D3C73_1278490 [compost metagenome]
MRTVTCSAVLSSQFTDQLIVTTSVSANRLRLNEDDLTDTSAFTYESSGIAVVVQSSTNVAFIATVVQAAGNKNASTVEGRTNDQQSSNTFRNFNIEVAQEIKCLTRIQSP